MSITEELMEKKMTQAEIMKIEEPQSPMALIQLAVEQNADPDRLGKLMDLQERWQRNQAAEKFSLALSGFQQDCPQIRKSRSAYFKGTHAYDYASIDDIMKEIAPILNKHQLSPTFTSSISDGMMRVVCRIRCGTHVEETEIALPAPSDMRVNDTQKMGAALSYAKRYALCAALNIIVTDEDTDANGMGEKISTEQGDALDSMLSQFKNSQDLKQRFLNWLGAESVYDIPASRYHDAFDSLKAKLQKEQGK